MSPAHTARADQTHKSNRTPVSPPVNQNSLTFGSKWIVVIIAEFYWLTELVLPSTESSSQTRVWAEAALSCPKLWPCSLTECQSRMGLSSHGQLPRTGGKREVGIWGTTKLLEQQEPRPGFPSLLAMTRAHLVNHFSSLPSQAWVPPSVAKVDLETDKFLNKLFAHFLRNYILYYGFLPSIFWLCVCLLKYWSYQKPTAILCLHLGCRWGPVWLVCKYSAVLTEVISDLLIPFLL